MALSPGSSAVAKKYGTLNKVLDASPADFDAIKDVGELTAQRLHDGLKRNSHIIDRLSAEISILKPAVAKDGPLTGKTFVLTGTMTRPRKEIEKMIVDAGGEMKGSVGRGVHYLVQADANSTSTKTQAAHKCGTQVISETALYFMMS